MSARTTALLAFALGAGLAHVDAARAQIFFQPFGGVYAQQIEPDAPPAFSSRQAVAGIVAREGFRLVGPLGSHGEQIVAVGVDRRGQRMRFVIDPYEGTVLNARRIGPPPPPPQDFEPIEPGPNGRPPPGYGAPRDIRGPAGPEAGMAEPDDLEPPPRRSATPPAPAPARNAASGSTRRAITPPKVPPAMTEPPPADAGAPFDTSRDPGAGG